MDDGQPQDSLDVSDPAVLRALGHPVRMRVLMEISSTRTLTATEVGRLTGLTPSAASHHLRHLEKHGLIERAPGEGDQRTRPWRRTARSLNIGRTEDAAGRAGLELTVRAQLAILADDIVHSPSTGRSGERATMLTTGTHRLTPDQARQLRAELLALTERWSRLAEDNPDDTPRVRLAVGLAELAEPGEGTPTP